MKVLILIMSLVSLSASASIFQCPSLKGVYFCKGVEGSHKDMVMRIRQKHNPKRIVYEYTYEQVGEPVMVLNFFASDQGEKNPGRDMIGKCYKGYYFNSSTGHIGDDTFLNFVDQNHDYNVVRKKDMSVYLNCKHMK